MITENAAHIAPETLRSCKSFAQLKHLDTLACSIQLVLLQSYFCPKNVPSPLIHSSKQLAPPAISPASCMNPASRCPECNLGSDADHI